ncbi:hypothetical protein BU25DRAFT_486891 [Macroventuria anomochaeta]|uniref:Uncharacterized protein n=1 Tax=Macroventuria anomochaeta TaxID=301207 RepID=A0ACB6SIP2_9PLEO|nr:uncharacterized protein BU25DRAFT_486891 [Macroventuria anomochaeta]KAF2633898.1 hypothetical protein BU25DRAFT_486891 [Macroventuria anomochaeta]
MISEPASPRPRRQAFIATCSPDELLGQVIRALCPRYNIDAPHLIALRKVLSSAIVAPRKPPQLKRTRPDKRIGEIGSIYDTLRRSPYGTNGPSVSANQSLHFHHKDPDFKRLLPQVDRSRYEWPDEPVSQEDSDGQEVPDSKESTQSKVSTILTPTTKRNVSSLLTESATSASPAVKKTSAGPIQRLKETRQATTPEQVPITTPSFDPRLAPKAPQKDASTNPKSPQSSSMTTITITSPDSVRTIATKGHETTKVSASLLHAAEIAIELPGTQDTQSVPRSCHVPVFHIPQSSDTQDTVNSTQQSEISSPLVDFVQCTPPTQEES